MYAYTLVDADERALFAYHWHPDLAIEHPHLHVPVAVHAAAPRLAKVHLPTARIALEDVLVLLLAEFRVRGRDTNWRAVLARTKTSFLTGRSWG
jgi:hypothetical protein